MDLAIDEVTQISTIIQEEAGDEAEIIFGAVHDPTLEGKVRVTVIATGFDSGEQERQVINHDFRRQPMAVGRATPQQRPASKVRQLDIEGEIRRTHHQTQRQVAVSGGASISVQPAPQLGRMPDRPVSCEEIGELDIPTFIRRQMD